MNTKKKKVEKVRYDIISGPNKDALFDSCKYAYSKTVRLTVSFVIASNQTALDDSRSATSIPIVVYGVRITGIFHEDGSGESFNLTGYCMADMDSPRGLNMTLHSFRAYYNSKNRKGYIIVEE